MRESLTHGQLTAFCLCFCLCLSLLSHSCQQRGATTNTPMTRSRCHYTTQTCMQTTLHTELPGERGLTCSTRRMPSAHASRMSIRLPTRRKGCTQQMGASMRLLSRTSPASERKKSVVAPPTSSSGSCCDASPSPAPCPSGSCDSRRCCLRTPRFALLRASMERPSSFSLRDASLASDGDRAMQRTSSPTLQLQSGMIRFPLSAEGPSEEDVMERKLCRRWGKGLTRAVSLSAAEWVRWGRQHNAVKWGLFRE